MLGVSVFGGSAAVDDAIAALSRDRVDLTAFASGGRGGISLRSVTEGVLPQLLDGETQEGGRYAVRGTDVLAQDLRTPRAAEAALKLVFQLVALRSGGLLLHAASVDLAGRGVLIVGPSGAGKSTLARMCKASGAALLTDETTGVIGGELHGTPFKSDDDLPGTNARSPLAAILVLEKGPLERVVRVPEHEAAGVLLAQVYRPPPGEIRPRELLRRAALLAASPGVHRFTFRKHPDAVTALRGWLERASDG